MANTMAMGKQSMGNGQWEWEWENTMGKHTQWEINGQWENTMANTMGKQSQWQSMANTTRGWRSKGAARGELWNARAPSQGEVTDDLGG